MRCRSFMSDEVMKPRYNIPLAEEREVALKRLKLICDAGFISVLDFRNNPLRIFAAHELAAIIDPAMTTKMTVQVGHLFFFYIAPTWLYCTSNSTININF
jgi:acyl-CoA oxidase